MKELKERIKTALEAGHITEADAREILRMAMRMELTKSDKEYAKKHGLSYGEMRDFKEDQIREEEMMVTWYQMKEKERKDFEDSPQAIYPAW
tara:strand:- start:553 stop:828 length:276 start_codon:yes stop_codon:yes gene_type:complete